VSVDIALNEVLVDFRAYQLLEESKVSKDWIVARDAVVNLDKIPDTNYHQDACQAGNNMKEMRYHLTK
jgi:hypothetical protein